jgi:hypothetical protein
LHRPQLAAGDLEEPHMIDPRLFREALEYTTEKPTMKLEDAAAVLAAFPNLKDIPPGNYALRGLHNQAQAAVQTRTQELLKIARNNEQRTLIDVQIVPSCFPGESWVSVRRDFSDGQFTLCTDKREVAEQLVYTFNAGKKAGERAQWNEKDVS